MHKGWKRAIATMALITGAPALAANPAPVKAEGPKEDVDQIIELVNRELEGGTKQDIDITMSIYCKSPDVVLFESGPYIVKGYDDLKAAWAAYFKAFKKAEASYTDLHVGASGDLGYAFSLHNWKFTAHDGTVREDQHRVTHVYRRVEGKWCIIHENDSVPVKIVDIDTPEQPQSQPQPHAH